MRIVLVMIVAALFGVRSSSAEAGPGLMERIVESPFLLTQRVSQWMHTPKNGCEKADIQAAINAESVAASKKAMKAANEYFGSMAGYMAEEHECALDAMKSEGAALEQSDPKALETALNEIARLNDQISKDGIEDKVRDEMIADREMLMALLHFGVDAGAQEYLVNMTSRPGVARTPVNQGRKLLQGLVSYANGAKRRMESDLKAWRSGAERSRAAIDAENAEFVGQFFDSRLRQVAQDPALFASLNDTMKRKLHHDGGAKGAYDVGRCLVAARFGETRQTVSAYLDGALLLGSVIPFAGWGVAVWRGYRAAEAAAALVEKGGRIAQATAKMRQRYQVIAAEQKIAGKMYSRVGTVALSGAVAKTGRDCYASCYENILSNATRAVEGQLDCKRITTLKGDFKSCAVKCARAVGRATPGIRLITPAVGDDTINNAVDIVR